MSLTPSPTVRINAPPIQQSVTELNREAIRRQSSFRRSSTMKPNIPNSDVIPNKDAITSPSIDLGSASTNSSKAKLKKSSSMPDDITKSVVDKLRKKVKISHNSESKKFVDEGEVARIASIPALNFYNQMIEEKRSIFNNSELKQRAKSARLSREKQIILNTSTTLKPNSCDLDLSSDDWIETIEKFSFNIIDPMKIKNLRREIPRETIQSPFNVEIIKSYKIANDRNINLPRSKESLETSQPKGLSRKDSYCNNNIKDKEECDKGSGENQDENKDEDEDKDGGFDNNDEFCTESQASISEFESDNVIEFKSLTIETNSSEKLLSENSKVYDGNPTMEHYFGKQARYDFFNKYRLMARKAEMDLSIIQSEPMQSPVSSDRKMSGVRPLTPGLKGMGSIPNMLLNRKNTAKLVSTNIVQTSRLGRHDSNEGNIMNQDDIEEKQSGKKSPRTEFIKLLVSDPKRLPPLPLVIRSELGNEELNLAHRSLGDDYIIVLSAVIVDLPLLTKVNLRGNRLTDVGMGKFIETLATQSHITCVDLSENKIDSKSAEALTKFLRSKSCSLTILRLATADVDDDEAAIFMESVEVNSSITELDMSHNKLGGVGEKSINTLQLSGGAAIAKALTHNETLKHLDLSWNKLGISSAHHLGNSLFINRQLMTLNLAYNCIKDDGAEAIGSALISNASITHLDISSNSIRSVGAIVIGVSLRYNKSIKYLNISRNSIGEAGGWAMVQSLNYQSIERNILFEDCIFDTIGDANGIGSINLSYPTGNYSVDLAKPRNRSIVIELYRMASLKRGCLFRSVVHSLASSGGKKKSTSKKTIKLVRPRNPAEQMGLPYSPWSSSRKRPRHPYTLMAADEWMAIESSLHLLDESTGLPWVIPTKGMLTFEYDYVPRCPTPIECLNATGFHRLLTIIENHPKETMKILKFCRQLVIESYQMDEILNHVLALQRTKDFVDVFCSLLMCVRDTSNMSSLFDKHYVLQDSLKEIQIATRALLSISMNSFTGHYSLDMDIAYDRMAAIRLMEISAYENEYFYHYMPTWTIGGFTSQKQNKNNFRNEKYRRLMIAEGLNDQFFARGLEDRKQGVLEFDFVSTSRPIDSATPIHKSRLEDSLVSNGLSDAIHSDISGTNISRRRRLNITKNSSSSQLVKSGTAKNINLMSLHPDLQKLISIDETDYDQCLMSEAEKNSIQASIGSRIVDFKHRIESDISIQNLHRRIENKKVKYFDDLRQEEYDCIEHELASDSAMFFLEDTSVNRILLSIIIRIVNPATEYIFETLACITKTKDGIYELMGSGDSTKSTILSLLGLESETARYEIGVVSNVVTEGIITPSHRRYVINEDIVIVGSEIHVRIKCVEWSFEKIQEKVKEVLTRVFACHGLYKNTIRLLNHKITEGRYEFPIPKLSNGIHSFYVNHQIDATLDGVPIDTNILLKCYMNSGRGSTPDDVSGLINTVWRWRNKYPTDRPITKVDHTSFVMEFWGYKLMRLRLCISSLYITCDNAVRIALEFPVFGNDGQFHRENAIVILFSRIIDIENFEHVLSTLPRCAHASVFNRIGWLNALNLFDMERLFALDLEIEDNRIVMIILSRLSLAEPGNNFIDPRHRRAKTDLFMPGWDLPSSWTVDPDKAKAWDGVPRKGEVFVTYTASLDHKSKMILPARKALVDRYMLHTVPRGSGEDFHCQDNSPALWNDMRDFKI